MTSLPHWPDQVAQFFGIARDVAVALLALIDDPSCWMLSRVEGVTVVRVPVRDIGTRALIARGFPGATLPSRPSSDIERLLVLQGEIVEQDSQGAITIGAELVRLPEERRELRLSGTQECIFCIWVGGGAAADRWVRKSGNGQ